MLESGYSNCRVGHCNVCAKFEISDIKLMCTKNNFVE